MNLTIGTCFHIKTKTFDDVYGEVIWKIVEMNLTRPDGEGIRCELLSGTGKNARPGFQIVDSRKNIESHFAKGLARLIPPAQAEALIKLKGQPPHGNIYTEID